jgi:hypothetical protein
MKILIKYATRGRMQQFIKAIQNIADTVAAPENIKLVVSVDDTDEAMTVDKVFDAFKASFFRFSEIIMPQVYWGPHVSKVHAINRDIDKVKTDWDILVNFSDDMEFVVNGWDKILIDKIQSVWGTSLDFFAHFNDGFVGHKLPTMSIMGREYYERFFYIYPPCYKSVSCDAEALFVAAMLGKHHYFEDVIFKHNHIVNIGGTFDKTALDNEPYVNEDTKTFHKRLAQNFYVNGGNMDEVVKKLGL